MHVSWKTGRCSWQINRPPMKSSKSNTKISVATNIFLKYVFFGKKNVVCLLSIWAKLASVVTKWSCEFSKNFDILQLVGRVTFKCGWWAASISIWLPGLFRKHQRSFGSKHDRTALADGAQGFQGSSFACSWIWVWTVQRWPWQGFSTLISPEYSYRINA